MHHLGVQPAGEHLHHHLAFVQAQQAVVDEHAGQLVADGAVDQRRRHAGIHAARQAEDDLFVAHLGADAATASSMWSPITQSPAQPAISRTKRSSRRAALHGVRHLGVELHGVVAALFVGHAGDRAAGRAGHQLEAGGSG
jgi:hypothetical protein